MITGIIAFLIIFAVIGSILYGIKLAKTEKIDAVFGNPERAKGGAVSYTHLTLPTNLRV